MDRKDPAMTNAKTTTGTEDGHPTKDVYYVVGPFTAVEKKALVRAVFFLIVLGTLTVIGVFLIHGDEQERNRRLDEQNQILRANGE